ncbi:MAG: sulfatase, partial [Planctomycetia bacterium]|nr:sulfatase [Planctomycetia bacterium]
AVAAAGVKAGGARNLDGVDLLPHLSGADPAPPHDVLCWRYGRQMAVRAGDWKLVRHAVNADADSGPTWKKVTAARLYNLATDVGESQDLAASMPEKVAELQARWDEWNRANVAPNPGGTSQEIW